MIYIVRGNDFNIKVALAKKVDDTTVPYELTNVTRLRLALVGHGMHVFAEDVEVSPLSSNTVVGMIPGRALLLGTYGLEIIFRDNGKDKRFFVDNMFEAVNELVDDSDDEAEGEGGGIEVTITIQPEDIDFAGETGTAAGFGDVTATIDSGIGTPSVEVTASGPDTAKNFAFSFHNLKGVKGDKGDKGDTGATGAQGPQGAKGDKGDTGATGAQGPKGDTGETGPQGPAGANGTNGTSAGFGTPTASVDANVGTPSVEISTSGPDTAKVFSFAFHNLKGATGETGAKGETGATGATGPQGPKGDQGNPGSSVDYPFTLANNLTTNDSTKALSAAQGPVIANKFDTYGVILSEADYEGMQSFERDHIYFVIQAENFNVSNNLTNCSSSNPAATVAELTAYSATITPNSGYKMSSVTVLMGGQNVTSLYVQNNVISIPSVTGDLVITGVAVALEQFAISNVLTNVTNSNAATTITENSSYSGTLTAASGYHLSTVTITMGGVDVTSSVYSNGSISIPSVTGDIVITASATVVQMYSITNSLSNVTNSNAATTIAENSSYSGTLTAASGYTISTVSITMGGVDITSTAYSNGNISIASVTGNIVITATAAAPIISISDSAAKAILVEHFDTNNDGEIDTMEAATPTTLGSYFKNNTTIQDISWLPYFTGLTTLAGGAFQGCTGVTTLDLTLTAPITTYNDAFRVMTGLTGTAKLANSNATFTRFASLFYGCNNLTGIDLRGFNVSNATTMIYAFYDCTKVKTINISGWNLSKMKADYDKGIAPTSIYGNAFVHCTALTSVIMDGCNNDTLTIIELALVAANIAANVTITVDGVNHTYDGTNWN